MSQIAQEDAYRSFREATRGIFSADQDIKKAGSERAMARYARKPRFDAGKFPMLGKIEVRLAPALTPNHWASVAAY